MLPITLAIVLDGSDAFKVTYDNIPDVAEVLICTPPHLEAVVKGALFAKRVIVRHPDHPEQALQSLIASAGYQWVGVLFGGEVIADEFLHNMMRGLEEAGQRDRAALSVLTQRGREQRFFNKRSQGELGHFPDSLVFTADLTPVDMDDRLAILARLQEQD